MNSTVLRVCGSLLSFGILSACGGASGPVGPAAAPPQRAAPAAKKDALLYISDPIKNIVNVYSFPQAKLVRTLTAVQDPEGLCADESGHVWVVETVYSKIVEFARDGTKPIATLTESPEYPDGCAVNRSTGDLAVANNNYGGEDPGSVAIYQGARGTPTLYSDPAIWFVYWLDYDDSGNLFVDGTSWNARGMQFRFAELPSGQSKIIGIKLSGGKIKFPGGVQYVNGGVAIGDGSEHIYQTSGGSIVGQTVLDGACNVNQFFIAGTQVVAPSTCGTTGHPGPARVLIYNYPAGGAPIKKLTGFKVPFAALVAN